MSSRKPEQAVVLPACTSLPPLRRDRRFRELSGEEVERLSKAAEAEAAARAQAKEEAEKAAKKGGKKGGGKAKKPTKGAAAPPPPTPEETAAVTPEEAFEPPSVLEVYEEVKREVERHRAFRKEEAARLRAEERLVPRDPTGEAVMQEVSQLVQSSQRGGVQESCCCSCRHR